MTVTHTHTHTHNYTHTHSEYGYAFEMSAIKMKLFTICDVVYLLLYVILRNLLYAVLP